MAFVENLTAFFPDFAVEAELNGDALASGVIFDLDYIEAIGNFVEGRAPVALAIASEVSLVAQGDALTAAGSSYVVRGVEPDGTGLVLLRLEETEGD